jgi:hypothetical protein
MTMNIRNFFSSNALAEDNGAYGGFFVVPAGETISLVQEFGPFNIGNDYQPAGPDQIIGWGAADAVTAVACAAKQGGLVVNADDYLSTGTKGLPEHCGNVTNVWEGSPRDLDVRLTNNSDEDVVVFYILENVLNLVTLWTVEG